MMRKTAAGSSFPASRNERLCEPAKGDASLPYMPLYYHPKEKKTYDFVDVGISVFIRESLRRTPYKIDEATRRQEEVNARSGWVVFTTQPITLKNSQKLREIIKTKGVYSFGKPAFA